MPIRTIGLLPKELQTDTNEKFFNATVEQLTSEPDLKKINGYIGRRFSPLYKSDDNYIGETTLDRTHYQLEPAVIVKDKNGKVSFVSYYTDLLDKIKYYGGDTTNQSRLFNQEYYSYNGQFDYDKLINFSQYYWLPDGPLSVYIHGSEIPVTDNIIVERYGSSEIVATGVGYYQFSTIENSRNPTITLVRGGSYTFELDQEGNPFWIQTAPGVSGTQPDKPNFSTREVLGVISNGNDTNTVTFNVPHANAQDYYVNLPIIYNVDLIAEGVSYTDMQGTPYDDFIARFGGIDGNKDLTGRYILFVDNDYTDAAWNNSGFDRIGEGYDAVGYDRDELVPASERHGVWRIDVLTDPDSGVDYFKLVYVQEVLIHNKVTVNEGDLYSGREFYRNASGDFEIVPYITAIQDELYYQDGNDENLVGIIKLIEPNNSYIIDIEKDIIGQKQYTSPNGVVFTNGLKVRFDANVIPDTYANEEYYVEGVGVSIVLVPVKELVTPEDYVINVFEPFDSMPYDMTGYEGGLSSPTVMDYLTINRASVDRNAWSRSNRWFHLDVINAAAEYNNTTFLVNQEDRAKRPIIEFNANLRLFNYGTVAVDSVELLDTTETDALSNIEGQLLPVVIDGIEVSEGVRVLFAADTDPNVSKTIYLTTFIDPDNDGNEQIHLVPSGDVIEEGDGLIVTNGVTNHAATYYYRNGQWNVGQPKTKVNQPPLFDVFDTDGISFGDQMAYENSTFRGTELFSYTVGKGKPDSNLGFPLKYQNFSNVGDILFDNDFDADTFYYSIGVTPVTESVNLGFLHKTIDRTNYEIKNVWDTVDEESKQYQLISHEMIGDRQFEIDVTPAPESSIAYYFVYVNGKLIDRSTYFFDTIDGKQYVVIEDTVPLELKDSVDILIYSSDPSRFGWYQVPLNLENNAQNETFESLTLGQLRNHIGKIFQRSLVLDGTYPGSTNMRDNTPANTVGGNILQHSAGIPYANLFLSDKVANFVDSLIYAQNEYSKFKFKFLDYAFRLALNVNQTSPVDIVDTIIREINTVKTPDFPWYASDMIPYGPDKIVTEHTVVGLIDREYELTHIHDHSKLSNTAVLVYINGVHLMYGRDYEIIPDRPYVKILDSYNLQVDDVIQLVEYMNTDGCWVPETPTKLGLYPAWEPKRYVDETYITDTEVIRGHDGSLTPVFGDFRDDILLELEMRIYNNLKIRYNDQQFNIYDIIPGKFRDNEYSRTDFNRLLSRMFFRFVGTNNIDGYQDNDAFDPTNGFTYNYKNFISVLDGEAMSGSWRAVFHYHYDTDRPHTHPWEMLGFSIEPVWWKDRYGPAPYTAGNLVLWDDLAQGLIYDGPRKGIDPKFARPRLREIIPVDHYGNLRSPDKFLVTEVTTKYADEKYIIGEEGPVETAWRKSSFFPFAMQLAMALSKPAKYFGLMIDSKTYKKNKEINQYWYESTSQRLTQHDIKLNGVEYDGEVARTSGYLNWVSEYVRTLGIDPKSYIGDLLGNFNIQLAYKVAGFTDKKYLKVIAEQSSPSSSSSSVIIPDEDFAITLNTSAPIARISYSAVIVEKTELGYKVSGYNMSNPHFTILPGIQNNNTRSISMLNETVTVYKNFLNTPYSVPYGTEFKSKDALVNFLIDYERWLKRQGIQFEDYNDTTGEIKDWTLSSKEFLYWTQQGWGVGNVMVLSPIGSIIKILTPGAVIGEIKNMSPANVMDLNFKPIPQVDFTAKRIDNQFELKLYDEVEALGFVNLDVVQHEHIMVFNNKTVFNDVLYQPELGNRQTRLKLVGFVTNNWNGNLSPGGFVYNNDTVEEWHSQRDYKKGDIVKYKSNYYVAKENLIAAVEFDYNDWLTTEYEHIKTGLLPNYANKAKLPETYYETDDVNLESQYDLYSKGLIGYRNRPYLRDLGLDDTSQIKFYQGFIKEKGTHKSFEALTRAKFDRFSSDIEIYEEWALRVGEYGAIDSTNYVEVQLDEGDFSINPMLMVFNNDADDPTVGAVNVYPKDIYDTPKNYDKNLFLLEDSAKSLDSRIKTAGYPKAEEVDYMVFDDHTFKILSDYTWVVGAGQSVWLAKDTNNDWDALRISSTDLRVSFIDSDSQSLLAITTTAHHNFAAGDKIIIRDVNPDLIDGWYIIKEIRDLNTFIVETDRDLATFKTATLAAGIIYKLESLRFTYAKDATLNELNKLDWRDGENLYIDVIDDYENWGVMEKSSPWKHSERLIPKFGATNSNYGTSVAITEDSLLGFTSMPGVDNGTVDVLAKDAQNKFSVLRTIKPKYNPYLNGFGSKIVTTDGSVLVVSADKSADINGVDDYGQIHIYTKDITKSELYSIQQVIGAPLTATVTPGFTMRYGSSMALSRDNRWLYVGVPGRESVYAYTKQKSENPTVYKVTLDDTVTPGPEIITLPFEVPDPYQLKVTDFHGRFYMDRYDYDVYSGGNIVFWDGFTIPAGDTLELTFEILPEYYTYVTSLSLPGTSDRHDYAISTSSDGSEIVIGVAGTFISNPPWYHTNVGKAYVFKRGIESFISKENQVDYPIVDNPVFIRVTINGEETTDYTYAGNVVTLNAAPEPMSIVSVDTNQFIPQEYLNPPTGSSHANDAFGKAVDICGTDCAIAVGMPNFDETVNQQNSGAVFVYTNQARRFGTIRGNTRLPFVGVDDMIRINDIVVKFQGGDIDTIIEDINNAEIPGVTAVNDDGYVRINSDSKIEFNKLTVSIGPAGSFGYYLIGFWSYELTGEIISPIERSDERFGETVKFTGNSDGVIIGSTHGASYLKTTFDGQETTFDGDGTRFGDRELKSGAVSVYQYIPAVNETIENMGGYMFGQQLTGEGISPNDDYGADVAVSKNVILVGSPNDDKVDDDNYGSVYTFVNPDNVAPWSIIRTAEPYVDIEIINRIFLYNLKTKEIVRTLDYVDPVKGKVLGPAAQEIDFMTAFDPARYNVSDDPDVVTERHHWGAAQVGRVWWNLDQVRYLEYEQDTTKYKSLNWGKIFPGSKIEVYEWVESLVLPSEYAASSEYDGIPKDPDDSLYAMKEFVDADTGQTYKRYYYWVQLKNNVDTVASPFRTMPVSRVAEMIANPKGQGVAYAEIIGQNALNLVNVNEILSDTDIVLHIDYDVQKNQDVIHAEYTLIQEGGETNIPANTISKLIDSLAGANVIGNMVPDLSLPLSRRYGIAIRPRQSMFINRPKAVETMVTTVNKILRQYRILDDWNTPSLYKKEEYPMAGSGEWDIKVPTYDDFEILDKDAYPVGYHILVEKDSTVDDLWTIYEKQSNESWLVNRVQSYDTTKYWETIDWYAEGYNADTIPDIIVENRLELLKLPTTTTDAVIKINDNGNGQWELIKIVTEGEHEVLVSDEVPPPESGEWDAVAETLDDFNRAISENSYDYGYKILVLDNGNGKWGIYEKSMTTWLLIREQTTTIYTTWDSQEKVTVGVEAATIQLLPSLYDPTLGSGFDAVAFDSERYDSLPQIEIRNIVESVIYEIFINELTPERNKVFFDLIRYIHGEQIYVDWIFKTSFISIDHKFSKLEESPIYQKDNQNYLREYIEEVKPYHTKIREYLLTYAKQEDWNGDVTDFDVPGYWDVNLNRFRSPSGEETEDEEILSTVPEYNQWYNNHDSYIDSITVINGGSGYTFPPHITIESTTGSGAKAEAQIANGEVVAIYLTEKGSGYLTTPTVVIEEVVGGERATAYAQLRNDTVRKIKATMKLDRITYGTTVKEWTVGETYVVNEIVLYNEVPYRVKQDFIAEETPNYMYLEVVEAHEFDNANDRTWAYYKPKAGMIGKDLAQLFKGIEYPGVGVTGLIGDDDMGHEYTRGFDMLLDGGQPDENGYVTTVDGIRPATMIVDGGEFVDHYTSHAPEELVPGRTFDTIDMQVFTLIGADYENDGANAPTVLRKFVGNGISRVFSFSGESSRFSYFTLYSYQNGYIEPSEYVVDYVNSTITFNVAPAANDTIFIYLSDHVAIGTIKEAVYTGDGTTTDFTIDVPVALTSEVFATIDGSPTPVTFTGDNRYTIASFPTAPAVNTEVRLRSIYATDVANPISLITTQNIAISDPNDPIIALNRALGESGPFSDNIIVELNGERIQPPNSVYFYSDGNRVWFPIPELVNGGTTEFIVDSDVSVYVDGVKLTSSEYSLLDYDPLHPDVRVMELVTPAPENAVITITLITEAKFSVEDPTHIRLRYAPGELNVGDVVTVVSYTNHDPRKIKSVVYAGQQPAYDLPRVVSLPRGFATFNFSTIRFEGPVDTPDPNQFTDPAYLWVTLNGRRLFPDVDFILLSDTAQIQILPHITVNPTDVITISAATENLINPSIGYRMFQDITGEVKFFRISDENSTRLAEDLYIDDEIIEVEDASGLYVPNAELGDPGIIFVNGERIAYFGIGPTDASHPDFPNMPANALFHLWRGTNGTGAPEIHEAGSRVASASADQEIPNTAESRVDTIIPPYKIWTVETDTADELFALDPNDYNVGAEAFVRFPQSVYELKNYFADYDPNNNYWVVADDVSSVLQVGDTFTIMNNSGIPPTDFTAMEVIVEGSNTKIIVEEDVSENATVNGIAKISTGFEDVVNTEIVTGVFANDGYWVIDGTNLLGQVGVGDPFDIVGDSGIPTTTYTINSLVFLPNSTKVHVNETIVSSAVGDGELRIVVGQEEHFTYKNVQDVSSALTPVEVTGWVLVKEYIDTIWYDRGDSTPANGKGLQSANTDQARFLKEKVPFIPDQ